MDPDAYLKAIDRESVEIAAALEHAPRGWCQRAPDARVADLGVHLGVIHRWATEMVRSGASGPLRNRDRLFATDPDDPALVEWFLTGARDLIDVLTACPLDRPVWSWMPNTTAAFWRRRQAHETTVHRWDAQAATASAQPVESSLAADGIDEFLRVFAAGLSRARSSRSGNGESFHFHCTDAAGEWTVRFDGPDIDVRAEHSKADVAVRGAASNILLFLWGRQSTDNLEVLGMSSLLDNWSELLPAN